VILLSLGASNTLEEIPEGGGSPTPVTVLDKERGDIRHTSPAFLPDGERFFFFVDSPRPQNKGIYLGRLGQKTSSLVSNGAAYAAFASPNTVLIMRGTDLYQQQFDLSASRLRSDPIRLAAGLSESWVQYPPFSVADDRTLTFVPRYVPAAKLVWYDRSGSARGSVSESINGGQPTLSPDGTHVIVNSGHEYSEIDLTRNVASRFPYTSRGVSGALYSPDGSRILYYSEDETGPSYYIRSRDESGRGRLVRRSNNPRAPTDWSPDGRYILGDDFPDPLHIDIWVTPVASDQQPFPLVQSDAAEMQGRFSPDGRWVAYTSTESGEFEVYVKSFGDRSKRPRQVSVGGGAGPMWSADGKELFYLSPDKMMMSVRVDLIGPDIRYGLPKPLFQTRVPNIANARNFYSVSKNPERPFLILNTVGDNQPPPIHVLIRPGDR
jgi:Tol biopolymer transport system component